MSKLRWGMLGALLRGMAAAVGLTLACMAALAALAAAVRMSDMALTVVNQCVKIVAIVTGVCVAVGRGGERGFFMGMALAMAYMALGYALYVQLGGSAYDTTAMLGEILLGAAVGGIAGAVLANLPPRKRRRA